MKYNLEEKKCEVGQAYVKLWTIRMCALGFGLRGNNRKYLSHLSAVNDSLLGGGFFRSSNVMLCYLSILALEMMTMMIFGTGLTNKAQRTLQILLS